MVWLWWIANALGLLVVIPAVVTLAAKVLKQLTEIGRYAEDVVEHGGRIAANLGATSTVEETPRLAREVRAAAARYADAVAPST